MIDFQFCIFLNIWIFKHAHFPLSTLYQKCASFKNSILLTFNKKYFLFATVSPSMTMGNFEFHSFLVKAMVFPVVMYEWESWTIKKAECRRINAFELWCWKRLLRVPWTARRSNQSILKRSVLGVLWKDWCWSWNSSTLATSWEELTYWKKLWCWEGLGEGGEGSARELLESF